jgi:SOS response regulatory protein OraA/RecX
MEAGYQSDERTAGERARVLAGRLQGDLAIRLDLRGRGISEADIDSALERIGPELERAEQLAQRAQQVTQLSRTLHRKGFGHDTIEAALRISGLQE